MAKTAPHGGVDSDACAHGGDMSSRASLWPCPQPPTTAMKRWRLVKSTTAYGHRRRTGPGRLRTEAPRRQRSNAAGDAVFFELFDEDTAGVRPGVLAEPRPQERVQRHTMEHIVDFVCFAPLMQTLDDPAQQMAEQLPDVLQFFDTLTTDPEQVIEVSKIFPEDVPMGTSLRDTRLAEQLVEGFLPGQSSTALHVSQERISERIVEQIVDSPVGGGLHPGQSTSCSHVPAGVHEALDEPGEGFFALFPKK